jgi:hypothetical protein
MGSGLRASIVVLPRASRGDSFDRAPMLHNFVLSDVEEGIKRNMNSSKEAFTNRKCETSLGECAMGFVVFHGDLMAGLGF